MQACLVLATIITIHEAGHFFAARLQNIHVQEFSVGFGPQLLKYKARPGLHSPVRHAACMGCALQRLLIACRPAAWAGHCRCQQQAYRRSHSSPSADCSTRYHIKGVRQRHVTFLLSSRHAHGAESQFDWQCRARMSPTHSGPCLWEATWAFQMRTHRARSPRMTPTC